jgi:DnaK suppressor protein
MHEASAGEAERKLVEEFRERLVEARKVLLRAVATTDEELASLDEQPGDPFDDMPVVSDEVVLSQVEGIEKHQLDEIEAAQGRLEAGTFGVCEGCARAIPLTRLRAMPTARFCVECQAKEEKGRL